ncbi:MAG TPA: SDR family NAD(P)-dependent oxidoreductase [Mycobacteriales bacterium]|nr:SDR family NAD(P)-dependent oxidoreductase [Mycobacteriales bacterium]
MSADQVAVITGASSGIGAAAANSLAAANFQVVLGARREDRLRQVADAIGPAARTHRLDVTDAGSIEAFAASVPRCDALICNAGGALGVDPVVSGDDAQWRQMWESNVLGVVRTVRAFLPRLRESADARIVVVTSVAGHQVYPGGGGYTSAKHGAAVVADTLRLELLGESIRVIEIAPGMVQTEFSAVRLGDEQAAAKVYQGLTPLTADDVAEAITWAVTRPAHMVVARMDLYPVDQATTRDVHRRE